MIREKLIDKGIGDNKKFRWRSHEISRTEGLSDAVFGFAITLLVVSLEVPRTYGELMQTMRGFGSFAICFTLPVSNRADGAWHDDGQAKKKAGRAIQPKQRDAR